MSANTEKCTTQTNYVVNSRVQWTDAVIKLLLAEVQIHKESSSLMNKQVWKSIAESINTHGYNLTADNCYIKWTGMKKKYKTIKDAKNQTGTGKQAWEYFDILNDILGRNPAVAPLSIASNLRGFIINNSSDEEQCKENEQNEMNIASTSTNILQNRRIRKRKSKTSVWMEELIKQREKHHEENYTQREQLLSLLEKRYKTG